MFVSGFCDDANTAAETNYCCLVLQSAHWKLVSDGQFSQTSNAIGVQERHSSLLGFVENRHSRQWYSANTGEGLFCYTYLWFLSVCVESLGIFYKNKIFQVFHLFC